MKSILLALLLLAPWVRATDVWFGDVKASSADGHYLAKAVSPENRMQRPGPFQSDFTFSLADARTQRTLWRYRGGPDAEPAGQLFVSDGGEVVSLGGRDSLTLFRKSGARVALGSVFERFSKGEVRRYCEETTAGTFWAQFSWNGFTRIDGKEYFYFRTYWGRIIAVDLERGCWTEERAVRRAIEDSVLAEALQIKALPASKYRIYCPRCQMMEVNPLIQRGIFVLVRHREPGIEGLLRLVFWANDPIYPDAKEFLPRLDRVLKGKYPTRQQRGATSY